MNEDFFLELEAVIRLEMFLMLLIACVFLIVVVCGCLYQGGRRSVSAIALYGVIAGSLVLALGASFFWAPDDMPAWFQAIGSIYAIVVAVLVSRHESRNAEERARQDRQRAAEQQALERFEDMKASVLAVRGLFMRAYVAFSYIRENARSHALVCPDYGPTMAYQELRLKGGKSWIFHGLKASDIRMQLRLLEGYIEGLGRLSILECKDPTLSLYIFEFCGSIRAFYADLKTGWNSRSFSSAPKGSDDTVKYPPGELNDVYTDTEKLIGVSEYLAQGKFGHYMNEPEVARIEELFVAWMQRADELLDGQR